MKRHFRPFIEKALIVITIFLFIIAVSVDSFSLPFAPVYIAIWVVFYLNVYLLHKYGTGRVFEDE